MLSLAKPPSLIILETWRLYPAKEGPTLKPSSSKFGTCQGRNYFTLAYQTSFPNWHFRTCGPHMWDPPWPHTCIWVIYENACKTCVLMRSHHVLKKLPILILVVNTTEKSYVKCSFHFELLWYSHLNSEFRNLKQHLFLWWCNSRFASQHDETIPDPIQRPRLSRKLAAPTIDRATNTPYRPSHNTPVLQTVRKSRVWLMWVGTMCFFRSYICDEEVAHLVTNMEFKMVK